MEFALSEEQEQLREVVGRFLAAKSPRDEVRRLMATDEGYDPGIWKQMAAELGVQGLAIPESYGGQGFGLLELGVVLEEMGRALLCAPFFSTVCLAAGGLLEAGSDEQKQRLLPAVASGEAIATVAILEPTSSWDLAGLETRATRRGNGAVLSGIKTAVLDGHIADHVMVVARDQQGPSLWLVDGTASGLERFSERSLDPTRKLARLELRDVPAERLPLGSEGLARTLNRAAVCIAAEMVGGAQACLDMAVDYARTRIQFDRPIGSFQAIKHRCVDVLVAVESARSATWYAAWAQTEEGVDAQAAASLAKAAAGEAFTLAAAENLHIHGGIGFTWEHDAHLYYRRARFSEVFLGDVAYHRRILGRRIGL